MRNTLRAFALTVALGLLAAACGGDGDSTATTAAGGQAATTTRSGSATTGGGSATTSGGSRGGSVSGSIFVSGSSTVEPISANVAQKFSAENPNVAIRVDGPGTGDGFKIFCSGESDISDASRPIRKEEADACAAKGIEFIELKVAIDGLSVVTSQQNNQVQCLSFEDLYALLGPESAGFDQWSDANDLGKQVGGSGDYPSAPLAVTAPGEESGTYDSFVELVLADIAEERGKEDAARIDYQSSPNDNVIVDGIAGNATSLGWVGFAFVEENLDKVKPLAVEAKEGSGCIEPTPATIADGTYPIARPLFIYVNKEKAEDNGALAAYVDFYLSDEGIATVDEVKYVALEDAELAKTRSVWEARTSGTREG